MIERWFVLRVLSNEDGEGVEPSEEDVSDALDAAEKAANATGVEGFKVKLGPEIRAYKEKGGG